MILDSWNKSNRFPFGNKVFSRLLHYYIPYSGTISPEVIELRAGYAKVKMQDKRKHRNHLNSIHAVALMNLAELTSGLAFVPGLPQGLNSIVVKFSMEYIKKARGELMADCTCVVPASLEEKEYIVEALIRNTSHEIVARGTATWRVRPKSSS